jgi:hypothetical protein
MKEGEHPCFPRGHRHPPLVRAVRRTLTNPLRRTRFLIFSLVSSSGFLRPSQVVAIGRDGEDIPLESALDHVWGYAVGLDMTRRDLQNEAKKKSRPWEFGKSFDESAPISELRPVAEIGHPSQGAIWVKVQVRGGQGTSSSSTSSSPLSPSSLSSSSSSSSSSPSSSSSSSSFRMRPRRSPDRGSLARPSMSRHPSLSPVAKSGHPRRARSGSRSRYGEESLNPLCVRCLGAYEHGGNTREKA